MYLSEGSHGSLVHSVVMPWMIRARDMKVGVQKAKAPVTKAMAVTPRVDHTKLRLGKKTVIMDQLGTLRDLYDFSFHVHTLPE